MANWFADNSLSIGHTPLVPQPHHRWRTATILAKIEGRNPAYPSNAASARWSRMPKARPAGPGKKLAEPTSGNTGIALAFVAAARGIPLTLTMRKP